MIYVALTVWLFLIIFAGIGVYRMLGQFSKTRWVDWALLPGTIVSEMAYIFGCLITGAEVRRARLISSSHSSADRPAPATEATPKLKVVGPIIASLVAIISCMAAIVIVHTMLGGPVIQQFAPASLEADILPQALPLSWESLWDCLHGQLDLVRRMSEAWGNANWLDWRIGLFVYLALCLSIRLAPVSRPVRPTLAAAVVISALIALMGMVSTSFAGLIEDLWPLVSYVWASLLLLLALVLLAKGVMYLVGVLTEKKPPRRGA